MRRPQLRALTGVRFFAAAHVVVYHYGRGLVELPRAVARVLDHGFAGVTLFFVLSGFILAYNHAGDSAPVGKRDFWTARFARIYPVYALGLLLALPALIAPMGAAGAGGAAAGGRGGNDFLLALGTTPLLLQGWVPWIAGRWNGPAWSLSAEALFYAAFPFLALGLMRLRRRGLLLVAAGSWAASLAVVGIYLTILPDGRVWAGMPTATAPWLNFVRYHPLARVPEFVLGVAAGRLFLLRRRGPAGPVRRRVAEAVGVVALLATLAVAASPVAPPFPMMHGGLLAPLFATALYALGVAGGRGPLSGPLASAAAVRLGEASYALYILHVPLHDLASRAVGALAWQPSPLLFFAGYLTLAVAASVLVQARFEVPARRLVRGWFERRERAAARGPDAAAQAA